MPETMDKLEDQYTAALRDSIRGMGEPALQLAYELGRRALAEGLGVLDMAAMYHKALAAVLSRVSTPEERALVLRAGASFFVESLSPFEMTHRGFRETNTALRRLNQTLEEESKRIAHALHDEAGQLLASVHLALEAIARDVAPTASHQFKAAKDLLDQIEAHLRRLSHELRPTILDDLGLVPALEFLSEGVSKRTKLQVTVEGLTIGRLTTSVETALYRIVQEALNNATRHAQASSTTIRLEQNSQLIRCLI